ncbi:MAG: GTPase Era [Gammaproteobacteria bacterium]|nr:MAG: GTPase Era [Gammaproteobacteria bacterium]UCH41319.1 MAG: GTPase Era [Gammaproteobacteria bacterium]
MSDAFRCGYVALIGKPNTGKSTLMNALVGEKLSITAHRPQTTRHQILGIKTTEDYQCIFVDTPGIHDEKRKAIHRYMNRAATSMFDDADLICVMLDITRFNQDDEKILRRVSDYDNVLIVVNKVDRLSREDCLPRMQKISEHAPGFECVPVSALTGDNLERLERLIVERLPIGVAQFPDDQLTDKSMRFISAEIVREKLFRTLKQELPYSITVSIDHYVEEADITRISATIWVERKSQKAIVIGKSGKQLKKIGSLARTDIEHLLGGKVYLQLWVKIRADWADDEQSLAAFGYSDGSQDI